MAISTQEFDLAQQNREQASDSTREVNFYDYKGIVFPVATYIPEKPRTLSEDMYSQEQDAAKSKLKYPEFILVHGLGSNETFFKPLAEQFNKIGLVVHAIRLPRNDKFKNSELLDWQIEATAAVFNRLNQDHYNEAGYIIGGHSRGGMIAAKAGRLVLSQFIETDTEDRPIKGVLLLAPAGFSEIADGNLPKAMLYNGKNMVANVLRHGSAPHISRLGGMVAGTIVQGFGQTIQEARHAISITILDDIDFLVDNRVKVHIIIAEKDGAIDQKAIIEKIIKKGSENISLTTIPTAHHLEEAYSTDIVSLTDPRTISGSVLSWLVSLSPEEDPYGLKRPKC